MTDFLWISLMPLVFGLLVAWVTRRRAWGPRSAGAAILIGALYVTKVGLFYDAWYLEWGPLLSGLWAAVFLFTTSVAGGITASRLGGLRWKPWFLLVWASMIWGLSLLTGWVNSHTQERAVFLAVWLIYLSCEIALVPVFLSGFARAGKSGRVPLFEYAVLILIAVSAFGFAPLPRIGLWLLALLAYGVGCSRIVGAVRVRNSWTAAFSGVAVLFIAWSLFLKEMIRFVWFWDWLDPPWWMRLHYGM